jgi:hypothetical protein
VQGNRGDSYDITLKSTEPNSLQLIYNSKNHTVLVDSSSSQIIQISYQGYERDSFYKFGKYNLEDNKINDPATYLSKVD